MNPIYFLIPFISAFIGWLTNYLAIMMVFRPYKPISILGLKIHGLIPKRKLDIAQRLAETIEKSLINKDDIAKGLKSEETLSSISKFLEEKFMVFLSEKLVTINPMLGAFLSDEIKEKIVTIFSEHLKDELPSLIDMMASSNHNQLDTQKIIYEKIEQMDLTEAENLVRQVAKTELRFIELFGGFLGFLIGCLQILLVYLIK